MGDIYDRSFLTIAASGSKDSSGGHFNKFWDYSGSLRRRNTSPSYSKSFRWSPVNVGFLGNEPSPLQYSPLSQRGWILQEIVLSPRIVHSTSHQIVWEYREVYLMTPEVYISP
jgi:Heterokaryon incompatibility protein (HET)